MCKFPGMREVTASEARQREHYEELGELYQLHYADKWSLRYRDLFLHGPMVEGLELQGIRAMDAMCGGGYAARYLMDRGAHVIGLDLAQAQIDAFAENLPGVEGLCASILDTGLESESLDLVVAVMGLHHLHPHLETALDEIHRVLKPGGVFAFCEPHVGSLLDIIRRRWYSVDPMFAEEEASINVRDLKQTYGDRFSFTSERYMGSLAYVMVLNSMILRVPLSLKPLYSPLAIGIEQLLNRFLVPSLSCYVCCQWRKL